MCCLLPSIVANSGPVWVYKSVHGAPDSHGCCCCLLCAFWVWCVRFVLLLEQIPVSRQVQSFFVSEISVGGRRSGFRQPESLPCISYFVARCKSATCVRSYQGYRKIMGRGRVARTQHGMILPHNKQDKTHTLSGERISSLVSTTKGGVRVQHAER